MIESLLHKKETDRQYFQGNDDLARSLFDKQHDLNGTLLEVDKIQLIIWQLVAEGDVNIGENYWSISDPET